MVSTGTATSIVVAEFIPAPGQAERLRRQLGLARDASRAEEGCLGYELLADAGTPDAETPDRFVLIERWRDEAARQTHLATPAVATFRREVPLLLAQPMTVWRLRTEA